LATNFYNNKALGQFDFSARKDEVNPQNNFNSLSQSNDINHVF